MYCDQFDSDCVDMTVDHKHWKAYSGPPATEDTGPVAARDVYNGDGILPLYDPRGMHATEKSPNPVRPWYTFPSSSRFEILHRARNKPHRNLNRNLFIFIALENVV